MKAMQIKLVTSEQIVKMYLARIAAYEDAGPGVNAFIHVNAMRSKRRDRSTRTAIQDRARPL